MLLQFVLVFSTSVLVIAMGFALIFGVWLYRAATQQLADDKQKQRARVRALQQLSPSVHRSNLHHSRYVVTKASSSRVSNSEAKWRRFAAAHGLIVVTSDDALEASSRRLAIRATLKPAQIFTRLLRRARINLVQYTAIRHGRRKTSTGSGRRRLHHRGEDPNHGIKGKTGPIKLKKSSRIGQVLLNSKAQTLATMAIETSSMRGPFLADVSTSSIEITWLPWVVGLEAFLDEYDVQWCLDSDTVPPGTQIEAWSVVPGLTGQRVMYDCDENFSSIPAAAVDSEARRLIVQGLPGNSPRIRFRVRARSSTHQQWGPYSLPSMGMQTLDSTCSEPITGAVTSRAIELKWSPPRDSRYGRADLFTLYGKKAGMDSFAMIKSGRLRTVVLNSVNNIPLMPNTTYVFRLEIRTSAGNLASAHLPVTTAPAPPDAPSPPIVVNATSRTVELRWIPPSDNGSPIVRYVLYGRRQRAGRFKRLFIGLADSFVCGSRSDADQLAPDTLYVFKLKASNSYGDSATSSVVTARTLTMSMSDRLMRETNGESNSARSPGTSPSSAGETKSSPFARLSTSPLVSPTARRSPDVASSPVGASMRAVPSRVSELPNGWIECWDPQRECCYYYNATTGITQWIHPIHGRSGDDPDLAFRKKRFKLLYSLRERDWPRGGRRILRITLRRSHLVLDSFQALRRLDVQKLKLKTKIIFEGEEGIDSGGLTKEWFLEVSRRILDPHRCLLKPVEGPSGKYQIDHRSAINEEHLQYFHFLGNFLAKAIYDRHLVDMPLCRATLKFLLAQPVTMDDLKEIDPAYHKSLQFILDNDIDDVLWETFSVNVSHFGMIKVVDLIPNGRNIEVTNENKQRYAQSILEWKTYRSIESQLKALRSGFSEMLPGFEIRAFTTDELNLLLNGKLDFNVAEMEKATKYTGGYSFASPPVQLFWKTVAGMSQEQRASLLQFATGCSKVPLDGFDPCFTITKSEADSDALPTAHTCFNQLVLPPYESADLLKSKLILALENTEGFLMT